jgi:hypothetical protein
LVGLNRPLAFEETTKGNCFRALWRPGERTAASTSEETAKTKSTLFLAVGKRVRPGE